MQPSNRLPRAPLLQVLQEPWARRVALYLGGQWVTLLGSALVQYALIWYVMRVTNSGSYMAVGAICGMVPQALIAPFAGVWADRYDRKKLIAFSDAGIAVATLGMAIAFLAGYRSLWLLFVLSAIRGVGSGIQAPAVSAVLPQIVPEEHLLRVNGINGSAQAFTTLVPPVISGWMLSQISLEAIFFVDVFTAIVGIGILLRVDVPRHVGQEHPEKSRPMHDLLDGVRYTWRAKLIRTLLSFYVVHMFLIVPIAMLSPLMVQRTFGNEFWRLTAIEVTFGAGSLCGGALIAMWGGLKNRIHTMSLAAILLGVLCLLAGIPMHFYLFLTLMVLMGICVPVYGTPAVTMMQENIEPAYMGRVFSLQQMLATLCFPLGMVFFGPLSDVMRIEWMFIGTGVLIVILFVIMSANRTLLSAGIPAVQVPGTPGEEG